MKRSPILTLFIILFMAAVVWAGTTGKIAGVVKDAVSGDLMPGVNIMLENTTLGAVTNMEGYYTILNVPPGEYTLRASFVGYTTQYVKNIRVQIDLTTDNHMALKQETLQGESMTVVAQRPVVTKDVSSSQANITNREMEILPTVSVNTVIGLQAGAQGLAIRGGTLDQTAFMVDGVTMRDPRDNTPYTSVSLTSINEIQIQTGGFNAEYGNVRSGLINVITKEGKKDQYSLSLISRYSPVAQKHFGPSPNDPGTFWLRPYLDDDVCWTGTTNGAWDAFTQKQYASFEGWNSLAAKRLADADPKNDLTPFAAQQLFLWEHRRQLDISEPDYDVDATFGGPVPGLSSRLGGLRFLASYRAAQDMYLVPLAKDGYRDYTGQVKLTADIKPNIKLMIEGLKGAATGANSSRSGSGGIFRSTEGIASNLSQVSYIDTRMFAPDYWCPTRITRYSTAAKLTHVLSSATFYEASLQRFESKYDTNPGRSRDTSRVYLFGNSYYVDEAPFGFQPNPSTGIAGGDGGSMRMGVGMANSRDTTRIVAYTGKVDFSSQLNRYNYLKAGVEFTYTDNNTRYAAVDEYLYRYQSVSRWHTFPKTGALYVQDKLEFEGMIANIGVRLDYSHAGGTWYDYDQFDQGFIAANAAVMDTMIDKTPTKKRLTLSPRLGIAFPISENSKIYFNYGHFRQLPESSDLFRMVRSTDNNAISSLGNPNIALPKTVAYELGYEHNLLNEYLLHLAGYYKDISNQSRTINYRSGDNKVNYSVTTPSNYQDIRGFEATVTKNRGNWVQGFANYTYHVTTSGNFEFDSYIENPALQRLYEREYTSNYQSKPVPQPFARANIYFFTPEQYGPRLLGMQPLGNWHLSVLASWSSGRHFTWTGGGAIPGIVNNVQWRDFYNVNLRLSKTIRVKRLDVDVFVDINNALNIKYMSNYGFYDGKDYIAYMQSLHLPAEIGDKLTYGNIPGNDKPGDYRTVPYEAYDPNDPDQARKQRILDTKAYIDMPNQDYFTFLNPRDIFFGIKLNWDISF